IDIPVLANVINYDFPPQPKVFIHRVGRTARAGQRGWAYSLVRDVDAPYLLDLQLFLGKRLVLGQTEKDPSYRDDVVVGSLQRDAVGTHVEWLNKFLHENEDVEALRGVAVKAEKLYMKTRNSASSQSAKRAREEVASKGWSQLHPLFGKDVDGMEEARAAMLARISSFKPQETIFEVGQGDKATSAAAEVMKQLRKRVKPRNKQEAADDEEMSGVDDDYGGAAHNPDGDDDDEDANMQDDDDDEDDGYGNDELEVTITNTGKPSKKDKARTDFRDNDVFMSYTPRTVNAAEERGYGVHSGGQGSSFVELARDATMDLTNDDTAKAFGAPTRPRMRWDAKAKKYVNSANDEDGSRGAKMIVGESGVKIAASFSSGRFDKWKRANRVHKLPQVGELVKPGSGN
ncbi:DBP10CT-domain-containing protein, partial [Trichoderma citrinoviride]